MQTGGSTDRIFLIGYMGVGKTTLGKELARQLDFRFVDIDSIIEQRTNSSISQFFALEGEEAFRKMEQEVLWEVAQKSFVVVSTGGGTPCFFDNIHHMLTRGVVVYLHSPGSALVDRLFEKRTKRPLLQHKTKEELRHFIHDGLAQRELFYRQAHIIYSPETLIERSDADYHARAVYALIQQYESDSGSQHKTT